jgi:hypothetical protein
MAKMRNAYKMLAGKPEGKRPCVIPRCRLEDNIKWALIKQGGKIWIGFI